MKVTVRIHVPQADIDHMDSEHLPGSSNQPQNMFVNYTHPAQQGDRQQRQKVASYIGTYYRNRSKPQARRKAEISSAGNSDQRTTNRHAKGIQQQASSMQVLNWRLEPRTASLLSLHDTHGLKVDPFKSYPIPYTENLPKALEYCLFNLPLMFKPLTAV